MFLQNAYLCICSPKSSSWGSMYSNYWQFETAILSQDETSRPRLIESMMVSRPRQGNLRQVFRLFKSHARLCRAWDLNNLKNKPEISLSRPQHHHWLFFSHIILSISTASNEVAILSVCPRIQKCNMQNSIIINCLKGNGTFIFVYLIIHLGK